MWNLPEESARKVGESATTPGLSKPKLCHSMDVNALNYCRFSLLPLTDTTESGDPAALLAIPNLIESALVRTHALTTNLRKANKSICRLTYGSCHLRNACTLP